ncbi:MAG: SUMF1/EgtB/PvdO family nonheme iron enzyme [Desulfococcaceae bacterium]|jgi:hypothetical protein|nr:SUMF1/EgtB/PvdO family nonheme iron enzyme [Desulfococcaceae bacterium]
MKKLLILFSIIFILSYGLSAYGAGDSCNPKPDPDDLLLPMPGNLKMVFRPVFLGTGDKLFALKEFRAGGDKSSGFKEFITDVALGGAFVKNRDWLYYMGKYEVTQAQYNAVMNPGTQADGRYPVNDISWFDAQDFIHKYNLWLYENAKDSLPKNEESYGFIRLPTEIECEFAARGGAAVNSEIFDKRHPYPPDAVNKYEWFVGHTSSYGKLKETGLLEPNPLKLYDMLGNVSEMTGSFYRVEYYQGRMGGFVFKGGNYTTAERQLRSSMRGEIPFYQPDYKTKKIRGSRQKTMGMRLVISSPIYVSRNTSDRLREEWKHYINESRNKPVAKPEYTTLPLSDWTDIQISDAFESLEYLVKELNKKSDIPENIWKQLGILNASFTNISSTIRKSENDSAYAWVSMSTNIARFIRDWMSDLSAKERGLKVAREKGRSSIADNLEKQVNDLRQTISDGISRYGDIFQQLQNFRKETIDKAFEKYRQDMDRKSNTEQIRFADLAKGHYREYLQFRRINSEKWKQDLEKLR